MRKRIILSAFMVGILLFLLGTCFIYVFGKEQVNTGSYINRIATKIFDYNSIVVEYENNEIKKNISIYHNQSCVFKDDQRVNRIRNVYGWNHFVVQTTETEQVSISFFKKNNWHVNNYRFKISCLPESLCVELEIDGLDSKEELVYR